jgi:hypothetical protein
MLGKLSSDFSNAWKLADALAARSRKQIVSKRIIFGAYPFFNNSVEAFRALPHELLSLPQAAARSSMRERKQ